jgi:hypothetical protein
VIAGSAAAAVLADALLIGHYALAPTRVTKCHQSRLHAVVRRQTTSEAIW